MSQPFVLYKRLLQVCIFVLSVCFSCTQIHEEPKARLLIELVDAPANYEQVWVEITGINVRIDGKEHTLTDAFDKGSLRLDLLALTGGYAQLLADADLPSGQLEEVQLQLGKDNAVVSGGQSYPLQLTEEATLKLSIRERLAPGLPYRIVLDFDADRSIIPLQEDIYLLTPILRTSIEALSGSIEGSVDIPAYVYALVGDDTLAVTRTNSEGIFVLRGMPPGSYSVCFTSLQKNTPTLEISPVQVTASKVTLLQEISITKSTR